jgi:hypothetical protein
MNVTIYSRGEAEDAVAEGRIPPNTAVINFHDPIRTHYDLTPVDYRGMPTKLFTCGVVDQEPDDFRMAEEAVKEYLPEAPEIADFIYEAYENDMDIICQCEYGQSRSAGCAAAILQHFYGTGIDIFLDYKRFPNRLVYHKIFDELEKRKKNG